MQLFTDKTATILKSMTVVEDAVPKVLLNFSMSYRRWFIYNEHTLARYFPVVERTDRQVDERQDRVNEPRGTGLMGLSLCIWYVEVIHCQVVRGENKVL